MNYLAHARLSFDDPGILVGNMISDYVKGRKKLDYPEAIQRGITLHRLIDSFTDEHPATRKAKEPFRPAYRLYSGAFIDVAYDHFLATDPFEFPDETLFEFSQKVYGILEEHRSSMPAPFLNFFPYMKEQNWLYNYRSRVGTEKSFGGVVRRALYLTESATAASLFEEHYQLLGDCYRQFWQDLKPFAEEQYLLLTQTRKS